MVDLSRLADIRREYGNLILNEENIAADPIVQFRQWFAEVEVVEKSDPTAMVLSTVDEQGHPDSRVVLLKGIHNDAFAFYTNYESTKAQQISHMAYAALNFYWPVLVRQIRIRGRVTRASELLSDEYFASRPRSSQLSAIASRQSTVISGRQSLEAALRKLEDDYQDKPINRPENWGGYLVEPDEIEFWQGRDSRLHDRLRYKRVEKDWIIERLSP